MKMLIRRVLNLLLYLSFCTMAGTGLLMAFRLIPGSRGGQGLEVLGWNRHEWGDLHTWVSYVFIALVVLHLVINWAWLATVAAKGHLWRVAIGLIVGVSIIAAFLLLPVKQRRQGRGHGRGFGFTTPAHAGSFDSSYKRGEFYLRRAHFLTFV